MLADIRSRNQNFCQRNGVIGEEVELEVCLGVQIGIDNTGNIDNEANGLARGQTVNSVIFRLPETPYQLGNVI
jgi:hypothetical protein